MLKELLSEVVSLANKSATPTVLAKPGDPHVSYLLRPGLDPIEVAHATPDVQFETRDTSSFLNAVQRHSVDREYSVWIGKDRVTAILDKTRRNRVTMPLKTTPMWRILNSLTGQMIDQTDLIRLLRTQFNEVHGTPELITAVRNVKFRTVEEINQNVQRGQESLGKSVEREVSSAGELNTTLQVITQVFDLEVIEDDDTPAPPAYAIRVDVDVELAKRKFLLTPLETDLETALRQATADLQRKLGQELTGPVFIGDPK